MLINFTVKPDDGEPYELVADSRDVHMWEKTTKGASLGAFGDDPHITDMYKIAHFAAIRLGRQPGTLAEFTAGCALDMNKQAGDTDEVDVADELRKLLDKHAAGEIDSDEVVREVGALLDGGSGDGVDPTPPARTRSRSSRSRSRPA